MGVVFGAVAAFYIGIMVFSLALTVVVLVAQYKLFEKAGEAGWKAIIPFYSALVMSKIATGKKTLGAIWIAVYSVFMIFYMGFYSRQMMMTLNSSHMSASDAASMMFSALFILVLSIGAAVLTGILMFKFAKSYGKSEGWCIAMIFLSGILIIAMGFDKDLKYIGPNGVPSDQYVPDNYNYNNNNNYYKNY